MEHPVEIVFRHFPHLSEEQKRQFREMGDLYKEWNSRINVISRKDTDKVYVHHILHSLAIAKIITFEQGTQILDMGSGGGFPGIPLAVLNPESQFKLVDSVGKKMKVAQSIADSLSLDNVTTVHGRAEELTEKFDFICSRAVAPLDKLLAWTNGKIRKRSFNSLPNGWICLKGGDLEEEIDQINLPVSDIEISSFFEDDYFREKKVLVIPARVK